MRRSREILSYSVGLILKSPCVQKLEKHEHHDDSVHWEIPDLDTDERLSNVERMNLKD